MNKIALSWSGGKDAAMALHVLQQAAEYEVAVLLTSVTDGYNRISMHGVREELLDMQAQSAGIPLKKIRIPQQCGNEHYQQAMQKACEELKQQGIEQIAFGDLYLEDVRNYRIENLAKAGMTAVFPLWLRDTKELAREFLRIGFKTVLACVDTQQIDGAFAGREYDEQLLGELPDNADPCGENGEFHSFVYDGPVFRKAIAIKKGEIVLRSERFNYCDLLPREAAPQPQVSSRGNQR